MVDVAIGATSLLLQLFGAALEGLDPITAIEQSY